MTFLQNLWRDLVDKRLWPVAVALVLALAAVPFLIGPGDPAPATAAAPLTPAESAAGGTPVTAQIAVAAAPGGKAVKRGGESRDPFKPLVFAKTPKTPAVATAAGALPPGVSTASAKSAAAAGTKAPPSTSSGAGASPATTTPGTATTPTTPATPTTTTTTKLFAYAIGVVIKRSGRLTTRHGLQALTYLPSPAYPLVTFLGVKDDGQTATFLLSDGVGVLGDATACRPSAERCDVVELRAGENVLIARTPKVGEPMKRFRLVLRSVALKPVAPKKHAAATRSRPLDSGTGPALPADLAPARQVTSTRTTG